MSLPIVEYPIEVLAESPDGQQVTLHRIGGGCYERHDSRYYPTRLWRRTDNARVKTALYFFPGECGYKPLLVRETWRSDDPLNAAASWPQEKSNFPRPA